MSNEIIARPAQPPMTLADIQALANEACKSGLFPGFTPSSALVLMMIAQAEGLHPIVAMNRYDIIQGRPAKKSNAILSDFIARGGRVKWIETTDQACEAEFEARGLSAPVKVKWTLADARRAGLEGKSSWKQYPRQLLRARVISEGIRIADPAALVGLYATEEVQDFGAAPGEPSRTDEAGGGSPPTPGTAAPSAPSPIPPGASEGVQNTPAAAPPPPQETPTTPSGGVDTSKVLANVGKALSGPPPCPRCGKPLANKTGKNGPFVGCSGYRDGCKFTQSGTVEALAKTLAGPIGAEDAPPVPPAAADAGDLQPAGGTPIHAAPQEAAPKATAEPLPPTTPESDVPGDQESILDSPIDRTIGCIPPRGAKTYRDAIRDGGYRSQINSASRAPGNPKSHIALKVHDAYWLEIRTAAGNLALEADDESIIPVLALTDSEYLAPDDKRRHTLRDYLNKAKANPFNGNDKA